MGKYEEYLLKYPKLIKAMFKDINEKDYPIKIKDSIINIMTEST